MIKLPAPLKSADFITCTGALVGATLVAIGLAGGLGDILATNIEIQASGWSHLAIAHLLRWGTPVVGGTIAASMSARMIIGSWQKVVAEQSESLREA